VSEFVARRLHLAHRFAGQGAAPENIVVDQSGVNVDALPMQRRREERARIRHQLGLKEADVLFMFAGAVRPEKGVIQLAQAFAQLSDEYPAACLAIAGGSALWIENSVTNENTELQVHAILDRTVDRKRAFVLRDHLAL
jgi:glycosyltransferase involved in cell wall biosynthesis